MHVLIPFSCLPLLAMLLSRLSTLHAAILALLVIVACGGLAPGRFATLTQRMRWIWLSLGLIYASFTPGEYLLPAWVSLPFTYEGLLGGAMQSLHLLATLALIACILEHYSVMQLLAGLYQCLRVCRLPEPALHAAMARVALVMEMQWQASVMQTSQWLQAFHTPERLLDGLPMSHVVLEITPMRLPEKLLLWLILACMPLLLVYYHP